MKDTINIAVVAFGRIAKTHVLAAYMANLKMKLPFELKVTHIITTRPEALCFHDIKTCQTLKEALESENDIDIVDICNINEAHFDDIQTAIQYQKAIICEKPLTDNLEKSKYISEKIKQTELLHGVPLIFRYLPNIHMLKRELEKKSLGNVIGFEAKYYHCSYLDQDKRNTWRTKTSSGGGASLDLGVHMMDCIRFIFGDPIEVKNEYHAHFSNIETDEIFHSSLRLPNNIMGSVCASRIYYQRQQALSIEVFCENGSYFCDLSQPYHLQCNTFKGNALDMKPTSKDMFMNHMVHEQEATSFHLDAHMCFLANFAKKVYDKNSEVLFADFEQAYLAQKLLSET